MVFLLTAKVKFSIMSSLWDKVLPLLGKSQNGASRQTLSIEWFECCPHRRQKSTLTHSGSSTGSAPHECLWQTTKAFGSLGHRIIEKGTAGWSVWQQASGFTVYDQLLIYLYYRSLKCLVHEKNILHPYLTW